MNVATRTVTQALRRLGFAFAADGSRAACLASAADGGWYAESWHLPTNGGPATPTALPLPGNRSESLRSQLVALPDGSVLVCRHDGERHDLVRLSPGSPGSPGEGAAVEQQLGTLRMPDLRLLPLPSTPGSAAWTPVALALGSDHRPATTVWLVRADGSEPEQIAEVAGLHAGGVWLDHAGALLALDRVSAGTVRSVALDVRTGAVTPLLEIAEHSNDRLVLFDPDTRFAIVRSDAPGTDRLGWGVLGGGEPLRFPESLHVAGVFLRPVALRQAADGPRVAVQIDHGAGSTLALWRPATGRLDPLPVPPGRLGAVGHWGEAGLRMPYSSPDHPAALATLDVDALLAHGPLSAPSGPMPLPLQLAPLASGSPGPWRDTGQPWQPGGPSISRTEPGGWRLDGSTTPGDGGRWQPAQSLELAGPASPLEAVVYGGDAWLSSPHLVLALHGGPADAWRLEFDPALQRMAAEGLAVVAPNQRGSTGYGVAHALAIRGAWGGPDLDDVLYLLDGIAGQRAALGLEPPALFGVSYGAFLALLAAAHAPAGQVARCAVVAPFLSGARLLAEAAPPVRALAIRLGGGEPIADARGPRDVLQLAHRLSAPLLVVHGNRDEVVPVSQSRTLRHELLRIGRVEGADFRYVEAAGSGHEVLAEEGAAVLHELLAGFLRTGRPG
ncbi:alpha/beta fold hydrolase [Streptomyces kaniharaensis]|uniref:Alpha/beta fold hydrolase n=1 Tax=Streptomyces kaniharaensis TaxID=212423 RepID=A0A6N7KNT8_9ACTN|nr:alpha/beta fold hydrolase [Streptomyces kaniharaensis]MQS12007.1 alpha/beta fold hydrolase [Streptomyces kaniharaensis]